MGFSTRKEKILNSISPISLVAIVALNLLLIYMNLVSLENQNIILVEIKQNTEIGLQNQELGLNATSQNHKILEEIARSQQITNETFHSLNLSQLS
jgi:hypothetical protein